MNDTYKIGEVAVFIGVEAGADGVLDVSRARVLHHTGKDCTIVGPYEEREKTVSVYIFDVPIVAAGYIVRFEDGDEYIMHPMFLRKKPSIDDYRELIGWDKVPGANQIRGINKKAH